ncbi:MAG: UDP-2,3-diacylglucosamine diphosphatase [Pseudomonadota bacterium]
MSYDADSHNAGTSGSPFCGHSAFISDVHLGTPGCRAEPLLAFLGKLKVAHLYLVGDIIDFERMQHHVYWPDSHSAVIRRILDIASNGTEVTYIPGNHDANLRIFAGTDLHGVKLRMNAIHTTVDQRRLLVTHGDQFDAKLRIGSFKEKIGSVAYGWLLGLDNNVNRVRDKLGFDRLRLASSLKMRFKSAQQYIEDYEITAREHAAQRNLDGIVCGHIHKPATLMRNGVTYYNDGDWVEHCSAVIEDNNGVLNTIHCHDLTESNMTTPQAA